MSVPLGRVRIVTDSTSDVPAALASELDITVVPCQVYFGQKAYRDGVDLTPEEFFDKLARSTELPRTSQPLMRDFVEAYRRLLDKEPDRTIVSIHVAGNFSGTVNGAWSAAQTLAEPWRVEVIDSGQLSLGLGWAVVEAARLARNGGSQAEIAAAARSLLPRLRTAAMLDTLDNLYKGGRISLLSAALGTALQIKPLLSVADGQVSVWGRVRTRSRALKQLVDYVRAWGPLAEMAVLHTGAEALARELAKTLEDLVPPERVLFCPAGPALTTHLGLGAVGVCALASEGEPPGDFAVAARGAG